MSLLLLLLLWRALRKRPASPGNTPCCCRALLGLVRSYNEVMSVGAGLPHTARWLAKRRAGPAARPARQRYLPPPPTLLLPPPLLPRGRLPAPQPMAYLRVHSRAVSSYRERSARLMEGARGGRHVSATT